MNTLNSKNKLIIIIISSFIIIVIYWYNAVNKRSDLIGQTTTFDGKKVLLHKDGHWEYLQDQSGDTICATTSNDELMPRISGNVINIKDGDTFDIRFDNSIPGFDSIETVRLMGIDAPELNRKEFYAVKAYEYLTSRLMNQNISIVFDKLRKRDSFCRILAYAFLPNGTCINSDMISKGFARIYTRSQSEKLLEYESLQYSAIEKQLGLWSVAKGRLSIVYIYNYDFNEYILFSNRTSDSVNISGWYFSDEQGDHIVIPENIQILPGAIFKFCTGKSECDAFSKNCLKLCTDSIWNNEGQTISLYSADGVLMDRYTY